MTEEHFDRYRILRRDNGESWELDRSAGCVTFKAVDISLELPVALTITDAGFIARDAQVAEFKRRARELMRQEHAGVARILNAGSNGDRYYFTTQFVAGESVHDHVQRRGALLWADALRVTQSVIDALEVMRHHDVSHTGPTATRIILGNSAWNTTAPDVQVVGFDVFGLDHAEIDSTRVYAPDGSQISSTAVSLAEGASIRALGRVLELMLTGHYPATVEEDPTPPRFDGAPYRPTPINMPEFVQRLMERMLTGSSAGHLPLTFGETRAEIKRLLAQPTGSEPLNSDGRERETVPVNAEPPVVLDENLQFTAYRPNKLTGAIPAPPPPPFPTSSPSEFTQLTAVGAPPTTPQSEPVAAAPIQHAPLGTRSIPSGLLIALGVVLLLTVVIFALVLW